MPITRPYLWWYGIPLSTRLSLSVCLKQIIIRIMVMERETEEVTWAENSFDCTRKSLIWFLKLGRSCFELRRPSTNLVTCPGKLVSFVMTHGTTQAQCSGDRSIIYLGCRHVTKWCPQEFYGVISNEHSIICILIWYWGGIPKRLGETVHLHISDLIIRWKDLV